MKRKTESGKKGIPLRRVRYRYNKGKQVRVKGKTRESRMHNITAKG
jgi:hypothetical protein